MMVDREARDRLAVDLRRLVTGRMINAEFDDRYYRCWMGSQDLAVSEIAKFAWKLYGSDRSHRLKGRYAVSPEVRRAAARAILFLHTNLVYKWPLEPEITLLWLLLPGCYLLLWIAALWCSFVSRLSDAWGIVFVGLAAVPVVFWLVGRSRLRRARTLLIQSGDVDVWPFISHADFEQARKKAK
jgi:hypothetical protein